MSVLLEFTVDADAFQLGRILSSPSGTVLELERLVPTGPTVVPFVWVTGDDYRAFEADIRSHPDVTSLTSLDRVGNKGLYRLDWTGSPTDLIAAIERSDAVILEARGEGRWTFRLRFPDHGNLSTFHDAVAELGIPIRVDRTGTLSESFERDRTVGLTPEQRETADAIMGMM